MNVNFENELIRDLGGGGRVDASNEPWEAVWAWSWQKGEEKELTVEEKYEQEGWVLVGKTQGKYIASEPGLAIEWGEAKGWHRL
jgi:hypothetical protein